MRFTSNWQCKTTEHTAQWQRCSGGHSCCIWLKNSFACACLQERPCIWARLVCERSCGRGLTLVSFRALYSRAVHTHQHTEIYTKTNNHMSNVHIENRCENQICHQLFFNTDSGPDIWTGRWIDNLGKCVNPYTHAKKTLKRPSPEQHLLCSPLSNS